MLLAEIHKTRKLECDLRNTRFILISAALIKTKNLCLIFSHLLKDIS